MTHQSSRSVFLSHHGPATGLAILGLRAHAFGRADCCCVQSGFRAAFGAEAEAALADILLFTRLLAGASARRIALSAPGCDRMTRDEVSVACAFTAAQAWDDIALEAHLSWLLSGPVRLGLGDLVTRIADTFAGHGLAFEAPGEARPVPAGRTPAFRIASHG